MLTIRYEKLLSINLSAYFMNGYLNGKMRYGPQKSPWISSLRGIDASGWKCEYEGARKLWFRPNLRVIKRSLRSYGLLLLNLTIMGGLPNILILN